jgi:hypothetical protein
VLVDAVESLRLKIARLTLEQSLHCEEFIAMARLASPTPSAAP